MKKLVMVCLALSIVSGVSIGYADNRVTVLRNGDVFKVVYKNETFANVKVQISDEKGSEVFSEKLTSHHGFARPYNFSQLPKGNYTICITDDKEEKVERICYKEDGWLAHISRVASGDDKVMVTVPNQGESEFSIHVLDHNDNLIYSEKQKTNAEYGKVFRLKGLDHGATIHLVNHKTGETKTFATN